MRQADEQCAGKPFGTKHREFSLWRWAPYTPYYWLDVRRGVLKAFMVKRRHISMALRGVIPHVQQVPAALSSASRQEEIAANSSQTAARAGMIEHPRANLKLRHSIPPPLQ